MFNKRLFCLMACFSDMCARIEKVHKNGKPFFIGIIIPIQIIDRLGHVIQVIGSDPTLPGNLIAYNLFFPRELLIY